MEGMGIKGGRKEGKGTEVWERRTGESRGDGEENKGEEGRKVE